MSDRIKTGSGEMSVDVSGSGIDVWIHSSGVGDEGGTERLHWVDGVTANEARTIAKRLNDAASELDGESQR